MVFGFLTSYLNATTRLCGYKKTLVLMYTSNQKINQYAIRKCFLQSKPVTVVQVRQYNDIDVPDFSDVRRKAVKNPELKTNQAEDARRPLSTYLVIFTAGIGSAYATKTLTLQMVESMSASQEVLALSKIEIRLSDIAEGKTATFKWRGKPLFVRHRTQSEIDGARAVDISTLRDPQRDEDRTQRAEWLVILGVCTHLGCVPISGQGDFDGYYCPCHGSHFDASGRARKGPAPSNLEVPRHNFIDENTLLVG